MNRVPKFPYLRDTYNHENYSSILKALNGYHEEEYIKSFPSDKIEAIQFRLPVTYFRVYHDIDSDLPDSVYLSSLPENTDKVEKLNWGGVDIFVSKEYPYIEIYDETPGLVNSLFIVGVII